MKLDPTHWLALSTLATAVIALVGVVMTLWSQRKSAREQWLGDRRLEAYSRLAFMTSEIASATATRGEVWHEPKALPYMLQDSQAKWEEAHHAYNEAQHQASLVAGTEVASLISEISECVFEMTGAAIQASRKGDIETGTVSEGDSLALKDVQELGETLANLRIELLKAARRELRVVR